jgi:hypothetical protein
MTEYERELSAALASCTFLPGSSDKRFCRDMAATARATPDAELTPRQRHYLEILAWKFRRQLPSRFVPDRKPLGLPARAKAQSEGMPR